MKILNRKVIAFIVIIIILILTIAFILLYRNNLNKNKPLVYIEGVNFTLNDIKDRFLESEYAQNNNCRGTISEDELTLTCNNNIYEFTFNGFELEFTSSYSESRELFKYIANTIEELHGYQNDEYLETMDKFFSGNIAITGLEYSNIDGNRHYSIYILEPLDKYNVNEVVTNETIKNITDTSNYEFQSLGYTINNIEVTKDSEEYLVIFSGVIGGQETYNIIFNINYYDDENNLVTSQSMDLSNHDPYGNPYLGFVVTSRLEEQSTFDSISKYSISLSRDGE